MPGILRPAVLTAASQLRSPSLLHKQSLGFHLQTRLESNVNFIRSCATSRATFFSDWTRSSTAVRGNSFVTFARRSFLADMEDLDNESKSGGPVTFDTPLEIVLYPHPTLRAENRPVGVFDDRLRQLAAEMFDLMYKTDGVGLAAPQVGVNVRMMVFNPEGEIGKGKEFALINPKITAFSKERDIGTEGCLSFPTFVDEKDGPPTIEEEVERATSIKVEYQNLKGKRSRLDLKGFLAVIFQHEYDHLEGCLFHDRMSLTALESVRKDLEKLEALYEEKTGLPPPERVAKIFSAGTNGKHISQQLTPTASNV